MQENDWICSGDHNNETNGSEEEEQCYMIEVRTVTSELLFLFERVVKIMYYE